MRFVGHTVMFLMMRPLRTFPHPELKAQFLAPNTIQSSTSRATATVSRFREKLRRRHDCKTGDGALAADGLDDKKAGEVCQCRPSGSGGRSTERRGCTVDELLPVAISEDASFSSEWSEERITDPPYGCQCAYFRARYFCPNLGDDGYPMWVPHAVSSGKCRSVTPLELAEVPLPPNFKLLFYGNSHLRQVVESMMCIFHEHVKTKRVKYYKIGPGNVGDKYRTVEGDVQCRSCAPFNDELVEYECMPESDAHGEACTCSDDISEFVFANGAIVHYYFAGSDKDKFVSDALPHFNVSSFSYYNAVFANNGNTPIMHPPHTLSTADQLKNVSVPFFWLSTYDGRDGSGGDVDGWKKHDREHMQALGAKFVRVGVMALGLHHLRKEVVEAQSHDHHFCLPGPPNEIALLLLKIVWASYFEQTVKPNE